MLLFLHLHYDSNVIRVEKLSLCSNLDSYEILNNNVKNRNTI